MTPTDTGNLAAWLLARIAEDEAAVEGIHSGDGDPDFFWGPDRIRTECEAKRRIVERLSELIERANADYQGPDYYDGVQGCEDTLALLALPYADHPDYRPEWRP